MRKLYALIIIALLAVSVALITWPHAVMTTRKPAPAQLQAPRINLRNMIKAYIYIDGKEVADPPNLNVFWFLIDILGANHPLVTVDGVNFSIGGYVDVINFMRSNRGLSVIKLGNGSVSTTPDLTFSPGSQGIQPSQCTSSYNDDTNNHQFVITITCFYNTAFNATEVWLEKATSAGNVMFFYTHLDNPIQVNMSYVSYQIVLKYVVNGVSLKGLMGLFLDFLTGQNLYILYPCCTPCSNFYGISGGLTTSTAYVDFATDQSRAYNGFPLYYVKTLNDKEVYLADGGAGVFNAGSYQAVSLVISYPGTSDSCNQVNQLSLIKIFTSVNYGGATDSFYFALILSWG